MRRALCVAAVCIIFTVGFCSNVFADSDVAVLHGGEIKPTYTIVSDKNDKNAYLSSVFAPDLDTFYAKVVSDAEKCTDMATDLSVYSISVDEFKSTYSDFLYRNPLLLIDRSASYRIYINSFGYVSKFDLNYTISKDEILSVRQQIQNKINGICDNIKTLSPEGQILAVHDYLADNCAYGINSENENLSYSIYGVFMENKAVCQGYAEAFGLFMNTLKIEHRSCVSDEINHIWNIVKINNNWYAVDVTWDDPVSSVTHEDFGMVNHSFFLSGLKKDFTSHAMQSKTGNITLYSYDGEEIPTSDNKEFESGYVFCGVTTPFVYENGEFSNYRLGKSMGYLFKSKKLTLMPAMVSEPKISSESVITMRIIVTGEESINANINVAFSDGKCVQNSVKSLSTGLNGKNYTVSGVDTTKLSEDEIKIMVWGEGTVYPVSEPVKYGKETVS